MVITCAGYSSPTTTSTASCSWPPIRKRGAPLPEQKRRAASCSPKWCATRAPFWQCCGNTPTCAPSSPQRTGASSTSSAIRRSPPSRPSRRPPRGRSSLKERQPPLQNSIGKRRTLFRRMLHVILCSLCLYFSISYICSFILHSTSIERLLMAPRMDSQ